MIDVARPISRGGATPIMPKNGAVLSLRPHGMVMMPLLRSIGTCIWRVRGKCSGSVPTPGLIRFQPQSCEGPISTISIASSSPGSAPLTAIGPVIRCGPSPFGTAASTALCSARIVNPAPGSGRSSSLPDKRRHRDAVAGFDAQYRRQIGGKKAAMDGADAGAQRVLLAQGNSAVMRAFPGKKYLPCRLAELNARRGACGCSPPCAPRRSASPPAA